jgi:hypothetical protein
MSVRWYGGDGGRQLDGNADPLTPVPEANLGSEPKSIRKLKRTGRIMMNHRVYEETWSESRTHDG